ncbi:quinone-dependent dihydroorotate dehydrogenase [Kiloniella sp. b19]|uniref:quinone-dependent dihydroorotate dehydrogenase n=1 Tax=Kiloniella sp. GXU_MW_B19 TaxID=3141326 RepID=UPI0031D85F3B
MSIYSLMKPLVHSLDPETAHGLAIRALKSGFVSGGESVEDGLLQTSLWGLDFPNPLGIAAGFDKDAEVVRPLASLGFGFVEVGSITPEPQPGNPKPRLFRLSEDAAVINRMGFNSRGRFFARERLKALRASGYGGLVGVNLGKNKTSEDAAADYRLGTEALAPYADYLVINVSSPNTPGLRALQGKEELEKLIGAVQSVLATMEKAPALVLKVAPDLNGEDQNDVAEVALASKLGGLIVSNTTIARPESLRSAHAGETGGLSGAPLFEASTQVLETFYRLTKGEVPLVGVGGVSSAEQAYTKIKKGASLVQLYSALVYGGPELVNDILRGLITLLRQDGFASVQEAVGSDVRI